jgi:hypothetical protein
VFQIESSSLAVGDFNHDGKPDVFAGMPNRDKSDAYDNVTGTSCGPGSTGTRRTQ